jgi:hypothetical protein
MKKYSFIINTLRNFFNKQNFVEIYTQNKLTLLSACNEYKLMCTFNYGGYVWPLPQSSVILMYYDLLINPELPGIYTLCTSYKNDQNYTKSMSDNFLQADIVSPLFECITFGNYVDMYNTIIDLLTELGFNNSKYKFIKYADVAKKKGVKIVSYNDELGISTDADIVFLEYIPTLKWGMKQTSKVIVNKLEILSFSEHMKEPRDIIESFLTVDNGQLSEFLYSQFSKERIEDELYKFTDLKPKNVVSCSINITNLSTAMNKLNMFQIN